MADEDQDRLRSILAKLLVKDERGDVIVKPLTVWLVTDAFETSLLLAMWMAQDESELGKGIGSRVVQLALMPSQALRLAAELKTEAERILQLRPEGKPN